jgi:hypothetical protein
MFAMRNDQSRLRRLLLACACGMVLCLPAALTAHAEDDDDTIEQKIIKNILGGMGVDVGRAGIDYRERSPLVIPPTRDLPPPESAAASARNPAWPREPERRAAVKSKPNARATINEPGTESVLTPDELRRGQAARAGRVTDPSQTTGSIEEHNISRQLTPSQLGDKGSIFSLDGLMGRYSGQTATFTEEPPRTSLTAPPPGYQTPSSAAPYAAGDERNGWKIPTIFDRPVGPGGQEQ